MEVHHFLTEYFPFSWSLNTQIVYVNFVRRHTSRTKVGACYIVLSYDGRRVNEEKEISLLVEIIDSSQNYMIRTTKSHAVEINVVLYEALVEEEHDDSNRNNVPGLKVTPYPKTVTYSKS